MNKDTRLKQVENMIFTGLKNLFTAQNDMNIDKFIQAKNNYEL